MRRLAPTACMGDRPADRTAEALESAADVDTSLRRSAARAYARKLVRDLRPEEFCKTELQRYRNKKAVHADIYGVENDKGAWFVKFFIEGNALIITSCHRPEWPLRCVSGKVVGTR
ncbi:MAG: hypothetical protein HY744_25230 [Deltaproteobacteria bacterium]|nr:hypothetical protein [Deltaproteobacteria bacterium]